MAFSLLADCDRSERQFGRFWQRKRDAASPFASVRLPFLFSPVSALAAGLRHRHLSPDEGRPTTNRMFLIARLFSTKFLIII